MTKTATLVKSGLENWRGDTALYKLSHPVRSAGGDESDYVVVASIITSLGAPETMMFTVDSTAAAYGGGDTEVTGILDAATHAQVLSHAGYLLVP